MSDLKIPHGCCADVTAQCMHVYWWGSLSPSASLFTAACEVASYFHSFLPVSKAITLHNPYSCTTCQADGSAQYMDTPLYNTTIYIYSESWWPSASPFTAGCAAASSSPSSLPVRQHQLQHDEWSQNSTQLLYRCYSPTYACVVAISLAVH
jgi:hypothetical protein